MLVFAEVVIPGKVTATIIGSTVVDREMAEIGSNFYQVEFSAVGGADYILAVDVDGVRYASEPFVGEADPVQLTERVVETKPPPAAPKGVRFFKKAPF